MPGYVTKQLKKYKHEVSKRPQHEPYPLAPYKYGAAAQEPIKKILKTSRPRRNKPRTKTNWKHPILYNIC